MHGDVLQRNIKIRRTRNERNRIHPVVANWERRLKRNGSIGVSLKTLMAVNRFYRYIHNHGLTEKIKSLCCFVPDNLIASITPLINTFGNDPWTNNGFTSLRLSSTGLKSTSDFYLDTGVIPTKCFSSDNSGGITFYTPIASITSPYGTVGSNQNGVNTFELFCTSYIYFLTWNNSSGEIFYLNTSRISGYMSGNRISPTSTSIYMASSTVNHNVLVNGNTSGGTRPNLSTFCFANNLDGSAVDLMDGYISFAAIHDGLIERESQIFYQAVQLLRQELGGGFI
jgi:hypothetical protein